MRWVQLDYTTYTESSDVRPELSWHVLDCWVVRTLARPLSSHSLLSSRTTLTSPSPSLCSCPCRPSLSSYQRPHPSSYQRSNPLSYHQPHPSSYQRPNPSSYQQPHPSPCYQLLSCPFLCRCPSSPPPVIIITHIELSFTGESREVKTSPFFTVNSDNLNQKNYCHSYMMTADISHVTNICCLTRKNCIILSKVQ